MASGPRPQPASAPRSSPRRPTTANSTLWRPSSPSSVRSRVSTAERSRLRGGSRGGGRTSRIIFWSRFISTVDTTATGWPNGRHPVPAGPLPHAEGQPRHGRPAGVRDRRSATQLWLRGQPDPQRRADRTSVDYGNFHPYPGGNTFSPQFGYDTVELVYRPRHTTLGQPR